MNIAKAEEPLQMNRKSPSKDILIVSYNVSYKNEKSRKKTSFERFLIQQSNNIVELRLKFNHLYLK